MSTQAYSVKIDCPNTLVSGEKIRGIVILTLNSPGHVNSISVGIVGTQATVFTYSNITTNNRTSVGREQESLVNKNFFFQQIDADKEAGEHLFEFEGIIPEGLLPSVEYKSQDSHMGTFYGQRRYNLSTLVDIQGQNNYFVFSPVSVKSQPTNQDCILPISATTTTVDLVFLCCINKGRVVLSGIPENPCVKPDDILKIKVTVENTSQMDQTGIKYRFINNLRFQLKGVKSSLNADVVVIYEAEICPLVAKGTKFDQVVEVKIPKNAIPSFDSEIFSSEYLFILKAKSLDEPDWTVKLPVKVFS